MKICISTRYPCQDVDEIRQKLHEMAADPYHIRFLNVCHKGSFLHVHNSRYDPKLRILLLGDEQKAPHSIVVDEHYNIVYDWWKDKKKYIHWDRLKRVYCFNETEENPKTTIDLIIRAIVPASELYETYKKHFDK